MNKTCENCALCDTCTKTIGNMFGFCEVDFVPKGTLRKYKVTRGSRTYIRHAESAIDAIQRVANQYGWGRLSNIWYDCATYGLRHASADVGWGRNYPMEAVVVE